MIVNVICESTFHTTEIPSGGSYLLTLISSPASTIFFQVPRVWQQREEGDLVQALQTCDLTLFHVSSITTFSDNILPFSSRLFCLLLSLPTFPGFCPQPSLLPLHNHSCMILCTVIVSASEKNVTSTSSTLKHVSPCTLVMEKRSWWMIRTLFINLQAQF